MSHTRKTIHYNPLPRVRLKGKAGAMGLYAPVAELEDASDAHSLISRMGRDSEFHQLRGCATRRANGRARPAHWRLPARRRRRLRSRRDASPLLPPEWSPICSCTTAAAAT